MLTNVLVCVECICTCFAYNERVVVRVLTMREHVVVVVVDDDNTLKTPFCVGLDATTASIARRTIPSYIHTSS